MVHLFVQTIVKIVTMGEILDFRRVPFPKLLFEGIEKVSSSRKFKIGWIYVTNYYDPNIKPILFLVFCHLLLDLLLISQYLVCLSPPPFRFS